MSDAGERESTPRYEYWMTGARVLAHFSPNSEKGCRAGNSGHAGWEDPHRFHERGRFMSKERRLLHVFFACGAMTLLSLLGLLGRPSVANIRTVGIVHLIATGVSLGAALVALVLFFVFRHRGPD